MAKRLNKKDFGINGIHEELGLQIKDAEFRGVVVTKLTYLEKRLESGFTEAANERASLRDRVTNLEKVEAKLYGVAIAASAILSFAGAWLKELLFR